MGAPDERIKDISATRFDKKNAVFEELRILIDFFSEHNDIWTLDFISDQIAKKVEEVRKITADNAWHEN